MSCSGSKKEVIQMLNLAVEKNVKSYIEMLPSKATTYEPGVFANA
jgi:D-arabinose 1-dehydrogenase-like Zn-dependent alcohol dehydrogenase